jgi:hypothetical protein
MKNVMLFIIMGLLIQTTSVSATPILQTDEYVCPKLPPNELSPVLIPEEFSIEISEGSAFGRYKIQ